MLGPVFIVAGIALNVYAMVTNSINIHKKKSSETAVKIRDIISQLESTEYLE